MSRVFKSYPNKITQIYKKGVHNGIDLVANINGKSGFDYLVAHSDGTVVDTRNNYNKTDKTGHSYGNYVKIKHDNGYYTMYGHAKYNSVTVKKGDRVTKGQVIGYMGNTGHSFGAHLHFEVRNTNDKTIDPTPYIDADLPSNTTESAYKTFVKGVQSACGAKVDGIAGPETLSKTVTLSTKKNSKHNVVKVLQTYLIALGYSCGNCGVDGIYGSGTKSAVKSFQKANGCVVDGVIDAKNKTWKKLLKLA